MDETLERALGALRHRDHTTVSLDRALERAGVSAEERERAIEQVVTLGYVDDARFASRRAEALSDRGAGDHKIELDLERHGVTRELVAAVVAALPPERDRAARILARRGATVATARLLASRGFSDDVVESVVADTGAWGIG